MGAIVEAGIFPHPPIVVPAVGKAPGDREKCAPTRARCEAFAARVAAAKPDVVVLITPHGPLAEDAMSIWDGPRVRGDLGRFGAPDVAFDGPGDPAMAARIREHARRHGVATRALSSEPLDHGLLVPLHFLQAAGVTAPVVPIVYSWLSIEAHRSFGEAIAEAAEASGQRVVLIASGDLSHRLAHDGPYPFHEQGAVFDQLVVDAIKSGHFADILHCDPRLREHAGECGYRSLVILAGAVAPELTPALTTHVATEVYGYDAPYGVGYLVARTTPVAVGAKDADEPAPSLAHPATLARQAAELYVTTHQAFKLRPPLPEAYRRQAATFVTVRDLDGELRGCVGTFQPTQPDLAAEIVANAIAAVTRDPRFGPVQPDELGGLSYEVSVLGPLEPVPDEGALDPHRYGVMVSAGGRQGLLLPALPGVDSAARQVAIARQKAGIAPGEPVQLFRFATEKHVEDAP